MRGNGTLEKYVLCGSGPWDKCSWFDMFNRLEKAIEAAKSDKSGMVKAVYLWRYSPDEGMGHGSAQKNPKPLWTVTLG